MLVLGYGVSAASGQAWLPERGATYLKLSQQSSRASEQYRQDGTIAPYAAGLDGNGFEDSSRYLYVEHGLTGSTALVLMLPYKNLLVRTPHPQASSGLPGTDRPIRRESAGFQNLYLGIRRGITPLLGLPADGPHSVAVNLGARLPLGYDRASSPAIGPGQVDLDLMLHYGLSLWPLPGYAQAGVGLRVRTNIFGFSEGVEVLEYGDEWLLHLEAGLSVGRWALVQGLLFGTVSNQPPEAAFDPQNPVPTRQRYLKPGVGLTLYPVRWLGVSGQLFSTPWGANTVRSTDWFAGVEARF